MIDYLALGHRLHEQWLASPLPLSDPLALVPSTHREIHQRAWRAVQAEATYLAAAQAVGVAEEVARRVLEEEIEGQEQFGAALDGAFARARERIFSGAY